MRVAGRLRFSPGDIFRLVVVQVEPSRRESGENLAALALPTSARSAGGVL